MMLDSVKLTLQSFKDGIVMLINPMMLKKFNQHGKEQVPRL
jgi:hypothetical protein